MVPLPLKEPLTYSVPESLENRIAPGSRVLVQVRRRILTGVALDFAAPKTAIDTKSIVEVLDDAPVLDPHLLKLARWISQYYIAPLGEVVATMLPPNSRRQSRKTVILRDPEAVLTDDLGSRLIAELKRHKTKVTIGTLLRKFPNEPLGQALARLESAGAVEIDDHLAKQNRRKAVPLPASAASGFVDSRFPLTAEQDISLRPIVERIDSGGFETFLLHGVT
ncbi:MAG TPA: hypothetical protein VJQ55_03250, partial [Candidatus Binatia bacterium]|nr:hypothetical protein [Candidatus Binatia bacterium]